MVSTTTLWHTVVRELGFSHLFLGVRLEIHPVFYAGSLHPEPALSAVQTNRD